MLSVFWAGLLGPREVHFGEALCGGASHGVWWCQDGATARPSARAGGGSEDGAVDMSLPLPERTCLSPSLQALVPTSPRHRCRQGCSDSLAGSAALRSLDPSSQG